MPSNSRQLLHHFWCRVCGIVWVADEAPICRHGVIDGPPVARMVPLPSWHPFAKEIA